MIFWWRKLKEDRQQIKEQDEGFFLAKEELNTRIISTSILPYDRSLNRFHQRLNSRGFE